MNQSKPYKIEIENKIVYLHLQEILDNNSFVEIGDYLEENAPLKEVHIDMLELKLIDTFEPLLFYDVERYLLQEGKLFIRCAGRVREIIELMLPLSKETILLSS